MTEREWDFARLGGDNGAIAWCQENWVKQRPVPTRLHSRETEGIGLFYAPAFAAALDGSPAAVVSITIPDQPCYHPTLVRGDSPRACPECYGMGVKEHRTDRFLYPMSLALEKLRGDRGSERHPHPFRLVIELAFHDWNWRALGPLMNRSDDVMEALLLLALRRLRSHYTEGPIQTYTRAATWIDKSQSQRDAEESVSAA